MAKEQGPGNPEGRQNGLDGESVSQWWFDFLISESTKYIYDWQDKKHCLREFDLLAMEYEYSKMKEVESQGFKFITVDKSEVIQVREKL